ncbi:M23 family metallopeptidase [Limimaricola pyoseonensis]|uniref:Murein DD-endopeptidase MepM and murein hydrolase activator NlpD, contain LysM domain n=1 Tax=Limimaricola pyoseonensis TaxID=521013 RepID=A0A1G6ZIT6_9RHOB|nr:M23 family metallopeptidase [Limimaricola pyoseonensis]SDE01715.1 Murein DD-endopeptidase MepM and murein hydrolase activator NlpD, contain LysM domain [Limimaricola pyoseonensis]
MQNTPSRTALRWLSCGTALALLSACAEPFDPDLRDYGNGFDTSQAALNPAPRPRPDDRGVISYPNYQVAVARDGDTLADVAGRVGIEAGALARYNGVAPDARLRRDEIVALPTRVAEPSPATGAVGTGPILPGSAATPPVSTGRIDVTTLAGAAIDRAAPQQPAAAPQSPAASSAAASPAPAAQQTRPAPQTGQEPVRHQVTRGETAYSVARLYNVPVRSLAEWNGLGPDLVVREGQFLLIPPGGAARPAAAPVSQPGQGSPTPTPPSAATPLPEAEPAATPTEAAPEPAAPPTPQPVAEAAKPKDAPMAMPAQGSIIRAYAKGRNDGIDIGAPAGSPVKAAAAGTVAAITTNTEGIQIVVIRHPDGLLTVYTHVVDLTVERGASVAKGQTIGKVKPGEPSILHFEVRKGMDSQDPTNYLP